VNGHELLRPGIPGILLVDDTFSKDVFPIKENLLLLIYLSHKKSALLKIIHIILL
jgi:hypothetical protein